MEHTSVPHSDVPAEHIPAADVKSPPDVKSSNVPKEELAKPIYKDVFHPALEKQPPDSAGVVTPEQYDAILAILQVISSDSQFALKAEAAMKFVMEGQIQANESTGAHSTSAEVMKASAEGAHGNTKSTKKQ